MTREEYIKANEYIKTHPKEINDSLDKSLKAGLKRLRGNAHEKH